MSLSLSTTYSGSYFVAAGGLNISDMTELKEAISGKDGATFFSTSFLNHYDNIRQFPIENLIVKILIGSHGSSGKLR